MLVYTVDSKHARAMGQQSFCSVLVYFYMRTLQLYLGLYAGSIMYIRVQYSRTNGPTKGDFGNWNFLGYTHTKHKKTLLDGRQYVCPLCIDCVYTTYVPILAS
jgi:hypothetical protein